MQNFQDTFQTRKQSFISAFSICMTVPLTFSKSLLKLFAEVCISLTRENMDLVWAKNLEFDEYSIDSHSYRLEIKNAQVLNNKDLMWAKKLEFHDFPIDTSFLNIEL